MSALTSSQLAVVTDAVDAVVEQDPTRLARLCDFAEDLYEFTHDYGAWGSVNLVRPPGPPISWDMNVTRVKTAPGRFHIAITMWTKQEGRSDLTLELGIR